MESITENKSMSSRMITDLIQQKVDELLDGMRPWRFEMTDCGDTSDSQMKPDTKLTLKNGVTSLANTMMNSKTPTQGKFTILCSVEEPLPTSHTSKKVWCRLTSLTFTLKRNSPSGR